MDYGRFFMFMVTATAAMAFLTHLWCWAYSVIAQAILFRELERQEREEEEVERRRAVAPRYMTWEQAMEDFRGAMPLDEILDRLNGEFPPKAADIQHGVPGDSPVFSAKVLVPILCQIALVTYLFGFVSPTPEMIEILLKNAKNAPKGGAGVAGGDGPKGVTGS